METLQDIRKKELQKCFESLYGGQKIIEIQKSENTDEIEKAEGSRGGKVIGHTKSGKPIYEELLKKKAFLEKYKDFTEDDHRDAKEVHEKLHKESTKKYRESTTQKEKVQHLDNSIKSFDSSVMHSRQLS